MKMKESWNNAFYYDRFMGRWSNLAAQKFLGWLGGEPFLRWMDVGCGTGSLTGLIVDRAQPQEVIGVDSSYEFVAYARKTVRSPAVKFLAGLAQALPVGSKTMDAVVSGLVLNFVPQPEAAIAEMRRAARPGGLIGVFVWDYPEGMQMLRYFWDAAIELDADAEALDEGLRFSLCSAGRLVPLAQGAGLEQVEVAALEVETIFQNFDDYWQPFLGNVGAAGNYVSSLSEVQREELRLKLERTLPARGDGSIPLTAKAWAVKGKAPAETER
jgi:SAM-dependent methyltransferase